MILLHTLLHYYTFLIYFFSINVKFFNFTVNAVLQMPPASNVPGAEYTARNASLTSNWIEERKNFMSEGSPNSKIKRMDGNGRSHGPADDTLEDLSHVATRLKVRDTLTTKIGDTMREQYLSLHRDQATNGVTVSSLHKTLVDHGTDVTQAEVVSIQKRRRSNVVCNYR